VPVPAVPAWLPVPPLPTFPAPPLPAVLVLSLELQAASADATHPDTNRETVRSFMALSSPRRAAGPDQGYPRKTVGTTHFAGMPASVTFRV
jgi:hypothetical protein